MEIKRLILSTLIISLTAGLFNAANAETTPETIELPESTADNTSSASPIEINESADTTIPTAHKTENSASAKKQESAPQVTDDQQEEENTAPQVQSNVYVTESNGIWTTKGPGSNYKLTGTVMPGDKLGVISEKNNYYQVYNPSGKIVWIPKKNTQTEPSFRDKYEETAKENKQLKYKLDNIDNETLRELKTTTAELNKLKISYNELKKQSDANNSQLNDTLEENKDLHNKSENKELNEKIRWYTVGACTIGAGLLAGIILVYLPRPRRKRNDYY